jgi:hypothetical protein
MYCAEESCIENLQTLTQTYAVGRDNSLGLNEDQRTLPSWPKTPQHNPEESIGIRKPGPSVMSRKN